MPDGIYLDGLRLYSSFNANDKHCLIGKTVHLCALLRWKNLTTTSQNLTSSPSRLIHRRRKQSMFLRPTSACLRGFLRRRSSISEIATCRDLE